MTARNKVLPVSIFLSSPSDLYAERSAIKERISLLQKNRRLGSDFRLDLYAYEDDVPPIAGQTPQASVDRYLIDPADADILICMLWSKLGSPFVHPGTGKQYASGTIYEFERAYERFQVTGSTPIILFYQCVRAPEESTEGSAAVKSFCDLFQTQGKYQAIFHHRTFQTALELTSSIDRDLQRVLADLRVPEPDNRPQNVRDNLIQKVKTIWIDGFLSSTFESTLPLPIRYQFRSLTPLHHGSIENGLTGLSMKGHFQKSDRRMLLVAPAGTGKTVALVQLLAYLIGDAEREESNRVPVILDLSAWTTGVNMRRWVLDELDRLYLVGRTAAKRMIDNNELIYLFDGIEGLADLSQMFGESELSVESSVRSPVDCFQAIHAFKLEVFGSRDPGPPLCLAVRNASLDQSGGNKACMSLCKGEIRLESLNEEDTVRYIQAEDSLDGLTEAMKSDQILKAMALKPLLLHLMTVAYRHEARTVIETPANEKDRLTDILSRYCDKRLRGVSQSIDNTGIFSLRETRRTLAWIAARQNRSLFLMEQMQPDALEVRHQTIFRNATSLLLSSLLGLCCSLPCAIAAWLEWRAEHSFQTAMATSALIFLYCQVIATTIGFLGFRFARGWLAGLVLGIAFGVVRGLVVLQGSPASPLPGSASAGLVQGVFTAIVAGLYFSICMMVMEYDINRISPLRTFSINLKRGVKGLALGLFVGMLFWTALGPARGISFGVAAASISFVLFSLSYAGVHVPISPNQGIVRSLRTATLISAAGTLTTAIAVATSYWIVTNDTGEGLENGIRGLSASLIWLMFGGIPVVQHYVLRIAAKLFYGVPIRLASFLKFAGKIHLLQQVGGAFTFRHELIRQFFCQRQ